MPSIRENERKRERVARLINQCRMVRERGVDPFEVDIKQNLDLLERYLPGWENLDELSLDAEALNRLSSVIELQDRWVRYRSSLLYVDPLLVEFKLRSLDVETLFSCFVRSWRPALEYEQLSPQRVKEAVDYWNRLPLLKERFRRLPRPPWTRPSTLSLDQLVELGVFSDQGFEEILSDLTRELARRADKEGSLSYWDFIYAETYEETVRRAYLTSFLITYGYAQLELRGLEQMPYLSPGPWVKSSRGPEQPTSTAVSVDFDAWIKMGEARSVE